MAKMNEKPASVAGAGDTPQSPQPAAPTNAEPLTPATSDAPTGTAGPTGPAESSGEQPAPPSTGSVPEGIGEQMSRLERRFDQALGAIESRDVEIAALRSENEKLRSAPVAPIVIDPIKSQLDRVNAENKQREAAQQENDDALQRGPLRFQCSLDKQPRMDRIVGAASKLEAEQKYRTYFGIKGILDPSIQLHVDQIDG